VVSYALPGDYDIQLIVTNSTGTDTLLLQSYIHVEACIPPTARFDVTDSTLCAHFCVDFTDLTLYQPISWQWLFPGAVPATSNFQNPVNICYHSHGVYDVTLIATNQYGTDTLFMPGLVDVDTNLCPYPLAGYIASVTDTDTICSGVQNCINFFDISARNPTSWMWYFPGGSPDTSSAQNPPCITYEGDGDYDVILISSNEFGADTAFITAGIHVRSLPAVFTSGDVNIFIGESTQLHAYPDSGYNYQWTPNVAIDSVFRPHPIVSPTQTQTYTVQFDSANCHTTRQLTVYVLLHNRVFIANSLSPEGTGGNHYIFVRGNNITDLLFCIYDRWGEKIFETNSTATGWDGTFNGEKLDAAVFVYTVRAVFSDGEVYFNNGTITLIR
jgi:gliding motility-associated-like protein